MWFRRKKKIDIPVETKQVGSVLWPYVSNVEVPNAKVINTNLNDLNDRVEVLENKPDGGISIDDVKTYVDPKLRGLNDKIDNLPPSGIGIQEVKDYVDPKFNVVNNNFTAVSTKINNLNSSVNSNTQDINRVVGVVNNNTTKITNLTNKVNAIKPGITIQEVKNYVDPLINDLKSRVPNVRYLDNLTLVNQIRVLNGDTYVLNKSDIRFPSVVSDKSRVKFISASSKEDFSLVCGIVNQGDSIVIHNLFDYPVVIKSIYATYIINK